MCGIQIGAPELAEIVANSARRSGGDAEATCGIQIGAPELSEIFTARRDGDNYAACGIQIGAPEADKTASRAR